MSLYLSYFFSYSNQTVSLFAILHVKKIRYNLIYIKTESIDKHLGIYVRYNALQGTEYTVSSISI